MFAYKVEITIVPAKIQNNFTQNHSLQKIKKGQMKFQKNIYLFICKKN